MNMKCPNCNSEAVVELVAPMRHVWVFPTKAETGFVNRRLVDGVGQLHIYVCMKCEFLILPETE